MSKSLWCAGLALALAACGGGGGGSSGGEALGGIEASLVITQPLEANQQIVHVGLPPEGARSRVANLLYTSVRVCVPGTQQCQVIDKVLVDTGSTGLRLMSSALQLPLPASQVGGQALYNCVQFIDQSYMWGKVVTADVSMGGEALDGLMASALPIQVTQTTADPAAPAVCAPTGFEANHSVAVFGANGILGVGTAREDCGLRCELSAANGSYHVVSTGGGVSGLALARERQLQHPVSAFDSDDNGLLIELPVLEAQGAFKATGLMTFGIGTRANNAGVGLDVLVPYANGYFTTQWGARTLSRGFIDSGSNGLFFGEAGAAPFPVCSDAPQWYCPSQTSLVDVVNTGGDAQTSAVSLQVAHAQTLFKQVSHHAFDRLAGPIGDAQAFDFGLPFFYGRKVYTAIEGASTPLGDGPFVAY